MSTEYDQTTHNSVAPSPSSYSIPRERPLNFAMDLAVSRPNRISFSMSTNSGSCQRLILMQGPKFPPTRIALTEHLREIERLLDGLTPQFGLKGKLDFIALRHRWQLEEVSRDDDLAGRGEEDGSLCVDLAICASNTPESHRTVRPSHATCSRFVQAYRIIPLLPWTLKDVSFTTTERERSWRQTLIND